MAVPSEATVSVGAKVTAALWNLQVRDAVNWTLGGAASRRPTFRAYLAVAQSIPNNTATTIKFDTVSEDIDSAYSISTGIYTCVTPGLYEFEANCVYASNSTGVRYIGILSSGDPGSAISPASSAPLDSVGRCSVSLQVRLTAGQTVNAQAFQTSGGALNTGTGHGSTFSGVVTFTGVMISA